jgi:hypothetical protein
MLHQAAAQGGFEMMTIRTIRTPLMAALALGAVSLAGCEQRRTDDVGTRPADRTVNDSTRPNEPTFADRKNDAADRADEATEETAENAKKIADEKTTVNAPSIKAIAMARCDREEVCKNLGADRKFASREACLAEIQEDMSDDLKLSECPGGIVQKELDECLAEIRNEDCKNPIDKLERLAACRTSDMCKAIN